MTPPAQTPPDTPIPTLAERCRRIPWYYAAAIALLLIAAGLRFYGLPNYTLTNDEAIAARNAGGSLSQLLYYTRHRNSTPILYPLALYGIQKIQSSPLTIRLLPAAASLLTIAAMLFLLPRIGVSRWCAFIAALLATVSAAAIYQAQDGREYGVDALLAMLLIAGLLLYLRTGRKLPLCLLLFLAPLVQYGLAIFGIAILAAAVIAGRRCRETRPGNSPGESRPGYRARIGDWLKQRIDLMGPAASLLAGSATAWFTTLRYQWTPGGWGNREDYLQLNYFNGAANFTEIGTFAATQLWDLLDYHLPEVVAGFAVGILGILLLWSAMRRRFHPILTLFLFSLGIGIALALLRWYPLGAIRQAVYLGPIIFLAVGLGFCAVVAQIATWTRRECLSPVLLTGFALLIAGAGAAAWQEPHPDRKSERYARYYTALQAKVQAGDLIYAFDSHYAPLRFYLRDSPAYHQLYHWECASGAAAGCVEETIYLTLARFPAAQRIWFAPLTFRATEKAVLDDWAAQGIVERIPIYENQSALLLRDTGWIREKAALLMTKYQAVIAGPPAARSGFDLYLRDNSLYLHKEPCTPAEVEERFSLELKPFYAEDAPAPHRRRGHFAFAPGADGSGGQCSAVVALPDYPLAEIRAGQYAHSGRPFWEAVIDLRTDYYRSIYPSLTAGAPPAQAVFDLYRQDNILYYYREPCDPSDVTARFFLHLFPVDKQDLPPERRELGFSNRDFDFEDYGAAFDGKCMATIRLPDYPLSAIRTGQFVPGEPPAWSVELAVAPSEH